MKHKKSENFETGTKLQIEWITGARAAALGEPDSWTIEFQKAAAKAPRHRPGDHALPHQAL